jgi:alcohol dehydrogenase class IV
MAHGIAIEGIKNIKDNLVTAFNDPKDISARSAMLVCSPMGSTCISKRVRCNSFFKSSSECCT